ncbi:MAG: L-2-amino-thiazoline-4-carboxylic acid hydrolase [Anaerolineales bacterium]|nr:L-2-amino-thiazoline-4-carboxylic acid hydrolase [Anaerolineales bacterium]
MEGSAEYSILTDLKDGWGKRDTAGLLAELDAKYGTAAGETVEKFLAARIGRDWKAIGEREARAGTKIEDFIRVLWEPLQDRGFEYSHERSGNTVKFCVTKCPVADLAERTGLQRWMHHMACATDFYTTPAFSPRIQFSRTRTLIDDGVPCNHTYTRKP